MSQKDIQIANQVERIKDLYEVGPVQRAAILDFADLIRADEREACAKVCESYLSESPHSWGGTTTAAAIRARGQA